MRLSIQFYAGKKTIEHDKIRLEKKNEFFHVIGSIKTGASFTERKRYFFNKKDVKHLELDLS